MAGTLQLRIVTPRRLMLDEPVREVTAEGTKGEFGVLPEHIAFLSSLESGTLSYQTERGAGRLAVRGGFAEVVDDVMTVLADEALFAEDIDVEAARAELQEAEKRVEKLSSYDAEFAAADGERRWAQARIQTAGAVRRA